jgi:flagellum-specific peptidoglycan hydrolase FlgJ
MLLLSVTSISAQEVTHDYIKKYSPICKYLSDSFEIPVELILGIAIVESASGTSRNAKVLNNHFGIKSGNTLRNIKGIRTRFRDYDSDSASFVDFCLYLKRRKFYITLKGNFNYNAWLNEMAKIGYSGSPQAWKAKIKSQIRKYNLIELNSRNAASKQP